MLFELPELDDGEGADDGGVHFVPAGDSLQVAFPALFLLEFKQHALHPHYSN